MFYPPLDYSDIFMAVLWFLFICFLIVVGAIAVKGWITRGENV